MAWGESAYFCGVGGREGGVKPRSTSAGEIFKTSKKEINAFFWGGGKKRVIPLDRVGPGVTAEKIADTYIRKGYRRGKVDMMSRLVWKYDLRGGGVREQAIKSWSRTRENALPADVHVTMIFFPLKERYISLWVFVVVALGLVWGGCGMGVCRAIGRFCFENNKK